ncbi:MAG: hypothetical protein KJ658_13865, partial [Proteobacteria bacterium]|nr:hypothetical protein [Pseudomonadota bacterium]
MPLILTLLVPAAIGLILTLFIRYLLMKKRYALAAERQAPPDIPGIADKDAFARKLGQLIQIPTVSWTDRSRRDTAMFVKFQETLIQLFPLVHRE